MEDRDAAALQEALVVAGPPLYLAVAWLAEVVVAPRIRSPAPRRFSFAWFATMVAMVVVGFAFVTLTAWLALRLDR